MAYIYWSLQLGILPIYTFSRAERISWMTEVLFCIRIALFNLRLGELLFLHQTENLELIFQPVGIEPLLISSGLLKSMFGRSEVENMLL